MALSSCVRKSLNVGTARFGWFSARSFRVSLASFGSPQEHFEAAQKRVTTLKEDPGNTAKLKLYALFKQATVGVCNAPKPGAFDFVGKAKWTAWNELGSTSQDEAKEQYVKYVNELADKIGTSGGDPQAATPSNTSPSTERKSGADLEITLENGVQTIKLNRPKKYNAITWEMYGDITKALEDAGKNDDCIVTMLTGAGDYYCSGNDLENFAKIPPEGPEKMAADGKAVLKKFVGAFIDFPKPLVAAINGPAVGIPVSILGLFDVVYASDRATFHTPFVQLGQSPEGCSSFMFPRIMGPSLANEMLLAGRKLTAAEALQCGFISDVFQHDEFWNEVTSRLNAMAKLPPKSLQLSKQLVHSSFTDLLHATNEKECELLEERWLSEECMAAIMAFMQRKN